MRANLRSRVVYIRENFLRIVNMLSCLQNEFQSLIIQFSVKTARTNEISAAPSNLTQEKLPIPATTPGAAQDGDSDQSQTTRGKSKHKNVYSK